MKICSKCYVEKDFFYFYKDKNKKDGYKNCCKECNKKYKEENINKIREYSSNYYKNNKDAIKKYHNEYYNINKKDILDKTREYRNNNNDKIKEISKQYYIKNREERLDYDKKYRKDNKDKIIEKNRLKNLNNKEERKKYYNDNREKIKEKNKNYYLDKKEKIKERNKKYKSENRELYNNNYKIKLKSNILFNLSEGIRSLIKNSFKNKGFKKFSRTEDILGISYNEFKEYLESKFENWMNYENRGLYNGEFNYGWDIDHIIPLSSIDNNLSEGERIKRLIELNHYTNLQPLCSKINRDIKRNSL